MSKLRIARIGCALGVGLACTMILATPSIAANSTESCGADGGPALLLSISGFKSRNGSVRVQSYGGDPARWFEKGAYLKRIDLPAAQADRLCLKLPRPGTYAVSVRHDVNGNGKSDRADGGGMSGNPDLSLLDLIFKRKPRPAEVQIEAGAGVTRIEILLNYVQGGAFKPVAERSAR